MNRTTVLALLSALAMPGAFAAQAIPQPTAQWESVLAAREQRAKLLRDELRALDARIESRVDSLVAALHSVADSKDTRSKVARMKEQSIELLKRNIAYYQNKRAALQEELRRPALHLTADQKRRGIAEFDGRIEKRIAQILQLQKSLPTHRDYERYTAREYEHFNLRGEISTGTTHVLNEDHIQNQRVTAVTNRQRREIEDGLRKSIARLEQNNRSLRVQIDANPKGVRAKDLTVEIAKNDALIAERHRQLAVALAPIETPTRQIGRKEAGELDKALSTAIADLRRDFDALFSHYNALIPELAAINTARDAIAAAKGQGTMRHSGRTTGA